MPHHAAVDALNISKPYTRILHGTGMYICIYTDTEPILAPQSVPTLVSQCAKHVGIYANPMGRVGFLSFNLIAPETGEWMELDGWR